MFQASSRRLMVYRAAFVVVGIFLMGIGYAAWRSVEKSDEASRWREHTHKVILALEVLERFLIDAETTERGYLLTGDEGFVIHFTAACMTAREKLCDIRQLTLDNSEQQQRLDHADQLIGERVNWLQDTINARREQGLEMAQKRIGNSSGRSQMSAAHGIIAGMRKVEVELLVEREGRAVADQRLGLILVISASLSAAAMVGILAWLALRNMALLASQEHLQTRLVKLGAVLLNSSNTAHQAQQIIDHFVSTCGVLVGLLHRVDDDGSAVVISAWGRKRDIGERKVAPSGLLAEVIRTAEPQRLTAVPAGYLPVTSGLGSRSPTWILLQPLVHQGRVEGVLELGGFEPLSSVTEAFIPPAAQQVAVALASARAVERITELLHTARTQGEELRAQQEELAQINADLEGQARQLTQASSYKSQFLSKMSHELRTPLNSLLILSRQLADNPDAHLSEREVRYARTIHDAGRDLLTLIESILDLAKIESGTVTITPQRVIIADLCAAVEATMRPLAEQKKLVLSVMVDPQLPPAVQIDGQRLQQIHINLLSNAVKFTGSGRGGREGRDGIGRVTLQVTRLHERLLWVVRDNGQGIPEDDLIAIFEPFHQGPGAVGTGTGLGLTISRDLARLLGGTLSVTSVLGEGSVFTLDVPLLVLPVVVEQAPPSRVLPAVPAQQSSEPLIISRTVLVIENDRIHCAAVVAALQAPGVEIRTVADGAAAVAVLASTKVDCIVLDLGLPDVGGIQLLAQLRKSDAGKNARIIVHTAQNLSPSELRELDRCADAVVLKRGATLQRLADEVTLHLCRSRPTLAMVAVVPGLAGRTILLADDDVRNVFALASVLEHQGLQVLTADNGRQVLQLLATTPTISLVLLDLMMPVLDGYTALAEIRADARWAALPVVVLTAKAMPGEREQAMAGGATDFLTKPVDTDRLLAILREQLC